MFVCRCKSDVKHEFAYSSSGVCALLAVIVWSVGIHYYGEYAEVSTRSEERRLWFELGYSVFLSLSGGLLIAGGGGLVFAGGRSQ